MVRKLRNKFVIVTTLLMVTVFGMFGIINTFYNNYWYEIEIADMLDWIAYSGIFTNDVGSMLNENLILDITKDEKPIIGIVLDGEGEVIAERVIGKGKEVKIDTEALAKMCEYKNKKNKIGRYFYSYAQISEDEYLLVIMDSFSNEHIILRIVGMLVLILIGIMALVIITFYLSRFVTDPAQKTLLREKQFISDASHELKTPLGAICINAQALEMEKQDNLYIKNIVSEANRMNRLIERLLTLSRLDEIEIIGQTNMSLSDVCEEMSLTYESLAYEKNVQLTHDIEENVSIVGNEDEIRQLLAILLDNAFKHTNANGEISINCRKVKNYSELSVTNTGAGIESNDIAHIFERFYTSDVARDKGSFGLGLAIAKSIVERHGGKITAESKPNEITIFKVRI